MMCHLAAITTKLILVCAILAPIDAKGKLRVLNETTWWEMLRGEWLVEFFAPWCPACKQLEPLWKEFAEWSDDLGIKVSSIDVSSNPGLSGRFMVTSLPTIFHVKDAVFRRYVGARTKDAFFSFIEEKKYMDVEPIPSWKAPHAIAMSMVAEAFELSMFLRNTHNLLVEDFGVPYWASYALFGITTVILGALLGLLIVVIVDRLCPVKTHTDIQIQDSPRVPESKEHILTENDSEGEKDHFKPMLNEEEYKRQVMQHMASNENEISKTAPEQLLKEENESDSDANSEHEIEKETELACDSNNLGSEDNPSVSSEENSEKVEQDIEPDSIDHLPLSEVQDGLVKRKLCKSEVSSA